MDEVIRITPPELADPRVDEQLSQQQTFGFGAPQEKDRKTPLFFKPWFALMVAGTAAALIVWGLIEPGINDGVRFRGQVESIHADLPSELRETFSTMMIVSSWRVLVSPEALVVDSSGRRTAIEDIQPGDSLEILADITAMEDGSRLAVPSFVQKLSSQVPATSLDEIESQISRDRLFGLALFPLMAGAIGLFIGATDGFLSRAWARAAVSGAIGLASGCLIGLVGTIVGSIFYAFSSGIAVSLDSGHSLQPHGTSLLVQIMGRGIAWAIIGLAAGLGQGIAMRSKKLLLNGAIGGTVGALFGGILFDPICIAFWDLYPTGGAEISRMLGFGLIGAATGLMIGLVELVAREAWVKLQSGPIAGKEFVLYRNPTWIGSSPKCEIYLFKDSQVAPRHAAIHRAGEHYELEDQGSAVGTLVGGTRVRRCRLRDRDRIQVGQTDLEFRFRDE